MSSKHPDNDIDKIFRSAIDRVETEPTDKFWNRAYEDILKRENSIYGKQVKRWKIISYIMATTMVLLAAYIFYMHHAINKIEGQITQVENKQLHLIKDNNGSNNTFNNQNSISKPTLQTNNTTEKQASVKTINSFNVKQSLNNSSNNTTNVFASSGLIRNSKNSGDVNTNLTNAKGSNNISSGLSGNTSPENYFTKPSSANGEASPTFSATQPVAAITPKDTSQSTKQEQTPAPNSSANNSARTANNATPQDSAGGDKAPSPSNNNIVTLGSNSLAPKLFISAFFSPQLLFNHIIDNDGWNDPHEVNSREQNNFIYTTGIRIGYNITKHWAVNVGGYYQSTSFSVLPTELHAQPYNGQSSAYLMVTSAGNIDVPCSYSWGNDSIRTTGSTIVSYASVPVQVRYTTSLNNHFGFYVIGGGTGSFLLKNNSNVWWETVSDQEGSAKVPSCEGLQKAYYSYNAGLGITYTLTKGFSVFGEPSFEGALTPVNKNSDITTYPYNLGLTVGLTLQL